MKRKRSVRSRRGSREDAGMSLFPFLAVLMCTMGALIVLLVVITRQARLQAAEAARAVATESDQAEEDLVAARELVQLQIDQLSASRQQTESQLADARLRLGHIEDHARRLREQLARLEAASLELEKSGSAGGRRRSELQAELERLEAALVDARRLLAEAQQDAKDRGESYAVVPYEGPNQTRRRPIYLECRKDAVVLEPEGIVFTASDFDGPLGPGNPLDVALRATREYWLSRRSVDPEASGEPYPLLLVRPDGIEAYYVARAAMKTWGAEFGYELIGENWDLEFQAPDQNLAEIVHTAVGSARIRQQQLAEAAPSHYNGSSGASRPVYRAAPFRGGVVADDGSASGYGGGFRSQRASEAFGSRFAESGDGQRQNAGQDGVSGRSPSQANGEGTAVRRLGEWAPEAESKDGKQGSASNTAMAQSSVRPLAETRGRDWGLPDVASRSVPITRPIRIDLRDDRLTLIPERGLGGERKIELGPDTADAVDEFVSAIWTHIDAWGIAGRGMYWKPTLKFHVVPGAEHRYNDLKILLDGSGIEVNP